MTLLGWLSACPHKTPCMHTQLLNTCCCYAQQHKEITLNRKLTRWLVWIQTQMLSHGIDARMCTFIVIHLCLFVLDNTHTLLYMHRYIQERNFTSWQSVSSLLCLLVYLNYKDLKNLFKKWKCKCSNCKWNINRKPTSTTMAHSSFPCFSDCASNALRKLQTTD